MTNMRPLGCGEKVRSIKSSSKFRPQLGRSDVGIKYLVDRISTGVFSCLFSDIRSPPTIDGHEKPEGVANYSQIAKALWVKGHPLGSTASIWENFRPNLEDLRVSWVGEVLCLHREFT